jgi:hypothetical protein
MAIQLYQNIRILQSHVARDRILETSARTRPWRPGSGKRLRHERTSDREDPRVAVLPAPSDPDGCQIATERRGRWRARLAALLDHRSVTL